MAQANIAIYCNIARGVRQNYQLLEQLAPEAQKKNHISTTSIIIKISNSKGAGFKKLYMFLNNFYNFHYLKNKKKSY